MALVADVPTFRVLFPELDAVPDARVQVALDGARDELSPTLWGKCYEKAILYFAAHEIALSLVRQQDGEDGATTPTGRVQSASVEGLSVSFAVPANTTANSDWLSQTPYGQAFLALTRRCLSRGVLSWP